MKKLNRAGWWLLCNVGLGWLTYEAVVNGSAGATRVVCGLYILCAIPQTFTAFSTNPEMVTAREKLKTKGAPVWKNIRRIADWSFIITFLWNGWWFTAVAAIFSAIAEARIYDEETD